MNTLRGGMIFHIDSLANRTVVPQGRLGQHAVSLPRFITRNIARCFSYLYNCTSPLVKFFGFASSQLNYFSRTPSDPFNKFNTMKTSFATIISKLLGLLATAAIATPIMPMANGVVAERSELEQKRAFGLVAPGHSTEPYFGRPVIGNYQSDIDAANPEEVLGKKHKSGKGSKGPLLYPYVLR
jgi:hypothetical protein